jgi:hypothetical protein
VHHDDPGLPDLADMEGRLALVFAPTGGVDLSTAFRFAGLGLPEFHLLDRDIPPATQTRQQVAAMVNGDTTSGTETRNANAQYSIPSENEWYKSAGVVAGTMTFWFRE